MAPLSLLCLATAPLTGDNLFTACSQLLSLLPGKTGSYLRIGFYRFTLRHCAPDCFIGFGTLFFQRNTIIESGVYIGPQCNIGACRIHRNCLIASGVHIMSGAEQHRFAALDTPIRDQGGRLKPVTIGEDCWIGNGTLIMADVEAQCVIGAGSVVTRPVPALTVAAGHPAKPIRQRGKLGPSRNEAESLGAGATPEVHEST
jgi:acetyltransferase-like isoleucine patch superfamily enzyme